MAVKTVAYDRRGRGFGEVDDFPFFPWSSITSICIIPFLASFPFWHRSLSGIVPFLASFPFWSLLIG
jgi:hypothetical protein